MTVADYIEYLKLQPHPEGGYYKESYRSPCTIASSCLPGIGGDRSISTAIYFLLEQGDFSSFHRIKSDECWHFYEGDTLLIHVLQYDEYSCIRLGRNMEDGEVLQFVVYAGAWF